MKKSFFKKFRKIVVPTDEEFDNDESIIEEEENNKWLSESNNDGELTVDVFETPNSIIIKTIVAGVKKEDMEINLSRDMITIKGKREVEEDIEDENYFHRELFWGTFSRTVLLPHKIDIERAEATENQGLLTIKLPKIDKGRQARLKVKSI